MELTVISDSWYNLLKVFVSDEIKRLTRSTFQESQSSAKENDISYQNPVTGPSDSAQTKHNGDTHISLESICHCCLFKVCCWPYFTSWYKVFTGFIASCGHVLSFLRRLISSLKYHSLCKLPITCMQTCECKSTLHPLLARFLVSIISWWKCLCVHQLVSLSVCCLVLNMYRAVDPSSLSHWYQLPVAESSEAGSRRQWAERC